MLAGSMTYAIPEVHNDSEFSPLIHRSVNIVNLQSRQKRRNFVISSILMAFLFVLLVALVSAAVIHFSAADALPAYPFNNVILSWTERVDDLASRLTLQEITEQMSYGGREDHAPGIPRLGIPPFAWISECQRGDINAGPATSFPQAIALAATFSREVLFNVSRATGIEVRAKFNNYSRHGDYGQHTSANCVSPIINIMRDPRWGRNQDTYSEDPYLTGSMAAEFVRGLQGNHPRYMLTTAACKHFAVHGGPENIPLSKFGFNAEVSERDLRMTFLPAFRMCVEAGVSSLMCSHNSINSVPACANRKLLNDIAREEWGFNGYVISDEGALGNIMLLHNYTRTTVDAVAAAINAGTNLEDGPTGGVPLFLSIPETVNQGKLTIDAVREAIKPLFYARMRLGLFDPDNLNPYAQLDPVKVVQSEEYRQLSLDTAQRSFVLLKNNNGFLPFKADKKFSKISVIGPLANNTFSIFGNVWIPKPDLQYITTPLAGLSKMADEIGFATACQDSKSSCKDYSRADIARAVDGSELVVLVLGTGEDTEAENVDRPSIDLPGKQLQVLKDAVELSANTPVILVLFNGGPLDITWAKSNNQVVAIIECFFPGQTAGDALRKVLYNEDRASNPAARLPATWPMINDQYPPMDDYTMVNRTYRYSSAEPLYPFGYGLSYSKFRYRSLDVRPSVVRFTGILKIDVYVTNEGPYDGDEVVQVYVEWTNKSLPSPRRQLVGFERVSLQFGQGVTVHFDVTLEQIAVWNDQPPSFVTLPGEYIIYAGGQQPFQTTTAPSNVLIGSFSVA